MSTATATATATSTAATRTFYKLDVQGIVYLIDPATSIAYTYDLVSPTEIGRLHWKDPAAKPTIQLRPEWEAIMAAKMTAYTAATAPHTTISVHDALAPTSV